MTEPFSTLYVCSEVVHGPHLVKIPAMPYFTANAGARTTTAFTHR